MDDIKLWLDDVRPAPDDSWVWVKTVKEAQQVFEMFNVVECSLDHDLGYLPDPNAGGDPREPQEIPWFNSKSRPGADGIDLVEWMCEKEIFPAKIIIHSWNPAGAKNMQRALAEKGVKATYIPFELPTDVA